MCLRLGETGMDKTHKNQVVGIAVMLFVAELGNVVVVDLANGVDEPLPHFFNRNIVADLVGAQDMMSTGMIGREGGRDRLTFFGGLSLMPLAPGRLAEPLPLIAGGWGGQ